MKKILGILVVVLTCVLGLCSCASPENQAINQDLVDRLNKGHVVAEDCYVKLYDNVNEKYYSIIDLQSLDPTRSGCVMVLSQYDKPIRCRLIIQYSNSVKIYYNPSYTWDKRDFELAELINSDYTMLSPLTDNGWMEVSNNRISYVIIN